MNYKKHLDSYTFLCYYENTKELYCNIYIKVFIHIERKIIMLKKVLLFIMAITFAFSATLAIPTYAEATNIEILSEVSDNEILEFINDCNLSIPTSISSSQDVMNIIRSWISDIESNPEIVFAYGFSDMSDFANALKFHVNNYYGIVSYNSVTKSVVPSVYTLLYSTVYEDGLLSTMYFRNCYGFAISEMSLQSPGAYSGEAITSQDLATMTISELVSIVVEDLEALGYNNITTSTDRPSFSSNKTTICVRLGSDDTGLIYDYHFMKVFSGNEWRHKPGLTAVLVYNYLPTNSRIWTNECYDGTLYIEGDITYDSSIYYISYEE